MSLELWIGLAIGVVLVYLLVMRVFFRQSKEVDKHIDYSKVRPVRDEDD